MDQEQQLHQLAATHLLQHTLRSLCTTDPNSHWLYAVFWRILPRNYPPPKWDLPTGSIYERSRSNRRNWILAWEDGYCNFTTASSPPSTSSSASASDKGEISTTTGLQPDIFFKMSHEIYNFGEGSIGKVASDHGHKWVFKEPLLDQQGNPSSWHHHHDSHPRAWEAQFQSGIQTIALIAVREGVVQLGSVNKVKEDLNYVMLVRKKFSYLDSIPGVFLPHPSSMTDAAAAANSAVENWVYPCHHPMQPPEVNHPFGQLSPPVRILPSMNSLETLLSKLPAVVPPVPTLPESSSRFYGATATASETMVVENDELRGEEGNRDARGGSRNIPLDMHNRSYYDNYRTKSSE